jgi:hypothetical protein
MIASLNGKEIRDSRAFYSTVTNSTTNAVQSHGGKDGTIDHMEYCFGPIPFKRGDVLKFEARFDLEKHPA